VLQLTVETSLLEELGKLTDICGDF